VPARWLEPDIAIRERRLDALNKKINRRPGIGVEFVDQSRLDVAIAVVRGASLCGSQVSQVVIQIVRLEGRKKVIDERHRVFVGFIMSGPQRRSQEVEPHGLEPFLKASAFVYDQRYTMHRHECRGEIGRAGNADRTKAFQFVRRQAGIRVAQGAERRLGPLAAIMQVSVGVQPVWASVGMPDRAMKNIFGFKAVIGLRAIRRRSSSN
jgi:hypothetical protein